MATARRRTAALVAAPIALLASLALSPSAGAVVYCVPDNTVDPSCQNAQATITGAFATAQGSMTVADTVRIDTGNYAEPSLAYNSGMAANVITVIGDGPTQTVLSIPDTMGNTNGLVVGAPAGSSISGVGMTIPMNADMNSDLGFFLGGGTVGQNLLVTGPTATNATGVALTGAAALDDSTVNLPFVGNSTRALFSDGNSSVSDSFLHADVGVNHSGSGITTTVDRSTVQASFRGAEVDSGTLNVRNSIIDLGMSTGIGLDATNLNPSVQAKTINADHVTIVGGIAGSIGFRVLATAAMAAQTSTGTLTNSVISGPATAIRREASNDGSPMMNSVANVTTDYSNYNDATNCCVNGMNGAGSITQNNRTNHAPGFVGGGNFHLAAGSALIDIGDPAAPMMGALDIDGNARALSMTGTCAGPVAGRRDIGADEFVPGTPSGCNPLTLTPTPTATPSKKKCKKRKRKGGAAAKKRCKKKRR